MREAGIDAENYYESNEVIIQEIDHKEEIDKDQREEQIRFNIGSWVKLIAKDEEEEAALINWLVSLEEK